MKICVTGYKSAGKTTFLNALKNLKQNIYICDEFINQIYKKGEQGYKIILEKFGQNFVNDQGVDKKRLLSLILEDKNQEVKLMNAINPLIKKWINNIPDQQLSFIELGTFLKYEQYFKADFDKILFVQRSNIVRLDNTYHISDQLLKYKVSYDYLFLNDGTLKDLADNTLKFITQTNFYN